MLGLLSLCIKKVKILFNIKEGRTILNRTVRGMINHTNDGTGWFQRSRKDTGKEEEWDQEREEKRGGGKERKREREPPKAR